MNKIPNKYQAPLIYLILTLLVLGAFEQLRYNDFINYDDDKYVTENNHVRAGLTRDGVIWAFTSGYAANWHPVTWLSHMLDCQLFGTDAGWHHLTNLLLHIINTLLLFAVLKQMTGALWVSGFVAACFALHPLHVESVAWIAERKDVLSTMFWMLTLLAYSHYVKRPAVGRYLIIMLTFALGLMAKPMLVTLPFVLLLLDYWPLGRLRFAAEEGIGRWHSLRGLIIEKVPLFALSVVSSVVTFLVQRGGGVVAKIDSLPLSIRLSNALVSYLRYIGKMFWPSHLAVLYPHPDSSLPIWQAIAAGGLLLGISILVICLAAKYRYLPMGWFWYLGALVPVIGLVQVGGQAMADRYTYIPLTGLFIIIAWGADELWCKWRFRRALLSTAGVITLAILLMCARVQVRHWQNSLTLWGHTLDVTKDNPAAHYNLGHANQIQGRADEAISHYRQALQIRPNYTEAHYNLGIVLQSQGRFEAAIEYYLRALDIKPDYAEAHNNIGGTLLAQGKSNEAISHFRQAIQLKPDDADFHNNLGAAFTSQGKLSEAIKHFAEALRIRPDFAEAQKNLTIILVQQNRLNRKD